MAGMTKAKERLCVKTFVGAGAAANTNIAVTGIATEDQIISAWVFTTAAAIASVADLTSECNVTSAGNIQFTTTSTASNSVCLLYIDASA